MKKSDKEQRKRELLQILQTVDNTQQDPLDEQEILRQCQSKDKQVSKNAFKRLVQDYQNTVYTYVQPMAGDETAFEITRDVFVQAYKHLDRIAPDTSLKVWLLARAKRQLLKAARKQEKWYRRLFPLFLYRRYQQRGTDELVEEARQAGEKECHDVQNLLSAYIDDELSPSETDRVETHLATCSQCAEEYDELLEVVDMVSPSELLSAPANLWTAINAVIEQESFFDRVLSFSKRLTEVVPAPVPQLAVVALSIAVIVLGVFYSSQRGYIQELKVQNAGLRATVRSLDRGGDEVMKNTFVILTGTLVSKKMPLEAAEYVDTLIPEPEKAPDPRMISGTIESLSKKIKAYLNALHITSIDEQNIPHETLNILKITAETPQYSPLIDLFLQQLEGKPAKQGEASVKTTSSIVIYIIDKK